MDPMVLLVSGLAAVSIFLLFFGMDTIFRNSKSAMSDRLGNYAARQARDEIEEKAKAGGKGGRFDRLAQGKAGAQLTTELARADLKITPGEFMAFSFIAAAGVGALVFLIAHQNIVIAAVGGVIGFFVPRWYVNFRQGARLQAFDNQLADTIVLLSNSLRSGYSLLQAMETASKELPAPISVEFTRVTREIGLGLGLSEALANLVRRIPSADLDLLVTAINVQHEVGGNLAEILDTIAYTIRERIRIVGEIRSITAQQRVSSYILTAIPGALGGILYILNPGYISKLWTDTCGYIMLGTGLGMVVLGYFVIQKIITIEV
ncbi:MAG: type II secretion system F family protein [Anaerolineae bacterium]